MGLCSFVFVILLVFKLIGMTDISWWFVFLPLGLPLTILLFIVMALIFGTTVNVRTK
jgi:hypothetical protein